MSPAHTNYVTSLHERFWPSTQAETDKRMRAALTEAAEAKREAALAKLKVRPLPVRCSDSFARHGFD